MLVGYEFHKYFTRFHVVLIAVLLCLTVGLTAFQHRGLFTEKQKAMQQAQDEMIKLYIDDPDEYDRLYNEHVERVEAYFLSFYIESSDTVPIFENRYIDFYDYGDISLFQDVETFIHADAAYRRNITSLLRDTVLRMEEVKDTSQYIYQYYTELCSHYLELAEREWNVEPIRGWNEYFSLQTPLLLLAVALIGTLGGIFTVDGHAGMMNILHTSKRGGWEIVRAKILFFALTSGILTTLFTLAPLTVFMASSGLSSLNQPIQILQKFQLCPYALTIGQYLIAFLLVRVLFLTTFSFLTAVVSQIFENEKFAIITTSLLVAIGLFWARISPSSRFYFLQKFSLTEIADGHVLFTRYHGLNIFGLCINYTFFVIAAVILLAVLLVTVSFCNRMRDRKEFQSDTASGSHAQYSLSLLKTEFYKQLMSDKYIYVVLAAIFVKCVVSGFYYFPSTDTDENLYRNYILQFSGEITEEKLNAIEAEADYIETSIANYSAAVLDYKEGKITGDEFKTYENRYNYAAYYQKAVERLCDRRDYLLAISSEHPNVGFVYEEGLERYLDTSFDVVVILALVLLGSHVFSNEYEVGFSNVLRTTKQGRESIFISKYLYALLSVIGLYIIFNLIHAGLLWYYYDMDFMSMSLYSMPRFENSGFNMSIFAYMILHQVVSLVGYIVCFFLICSLSVIMENQIKAIIVGGGMIAIPYFIESLDIPIVGYMNYPAFISPKTVETDWLLYTVCTAIMCFSIVLASKKWNTWRYSK